MSQTPAAPEVIRWTPRSGDHGDCAITALALACGITYETALSASLAAHPSSLDGMALKHIRKAAGYLGFKTRAVTKFDLTEDTGILWVVGRDDDESHVVYLWEGRILEPMCGVYEMWLSGEDFVNHYKYDTVKLITVERI